MTETTFTDGEFGTIYRAFGYRNGYAIAEREGNDLVSEIDPRGNVTRYTVDGVTSRNEEVTDRLGNKTAYEYDTAGRTTKVTSKKPKRDEDGNIVYDSENKIVYEEVANVAYAYDAFDNMTEIARGDNMKYTLGYNPFHNLESIGINGKTEKLVQYTYKNNNGRLKEITYANGDKMTATYNGMGQLVAEKWYNSANELTAHYKYVYDGDGNIVRSIDILGLKEYTYTYEEGRIIRATESDITLSGEIVIAKNLLNLVRYVYDNEGTLTKKIVTPANGTAQTTYYETTDDNTVVKFKVDGKTITSHSKIDAFGRKVFDELQLGTGFVSRQFIYHAGDVTDKHTENGLLKSSATTQLVSQIVLSDGRTLSYEYDAEERITKVIDSVEGTTEYTYDALGQLLTETVNGVAVNTMTYDNYGNITNRNGEPYVYGDGAWKDLLVSWNGYSIAYDAQGNPTNYMGHTLTWEKGRQLKSYDDNIQYTYNANGIRTSKTVDGVRHDYVLEGTKILRETWGNNTLIPLYDNEDSVCGILYNNVPYYFLKNLQGDVLSVVDASGETVAKYWYDTWGLCICQLNKDGIGLINPFRYRGYYYDEETCLYYLQSRYYNAAVGRFINADMPEIIMISVDETLPNNLFSYCFNSPVNLTDVWGFLSSFRRFLSNLKGKILSLASGIWKWFKSLFRKSTGRNTVTVIMAKDSPSWLKTSVVMANDLKRALEAAAISVLLVDKSDFLRKWKNITSYYVIIHTHGSPSSLNGKDSIEIFNTKNAPKMARNTRIKLVVCTACSTAGDNKKEDNIATVLSKKISKKGIVFANKHTVGGFDRTFAGLLDHKETAGWKAYQNGTVVSTNIPVMLTMELATEIYNDLKS